MASTSLTSFCNKEEFVWITIMTCKILPTSKTEFLYWCLPACPPLFSSSLSPVFPPSAPFSKGCFFFLPTFSFPSSFPPSLYPSLPIFFPPSFLSSKSGLYIKGEGERERWREILPSADLLPQRPVARSWARSKLGPWNSMWVLLVGRYPYALSICLCFPRHVSGLLDLKWKVQRTCTCSHVLSYS